MENYFEPSMSNFMDESFSELFGRRRRRRKHRKNKNQPTNIVSSTTTSSGGTVSTVSSTNSNNPKATLTETSVIESGLSLSPKLAVALYNLKIYKRTEDDKLFPEKDVKKGDELPIDSIVDFIPKGYADGVWKVGDNKYVKLLDNYNFSKNKKGGLISIKDIPIFSIDKNDNTYSTSEYVKKDTPIIGENIGRIWFRVKSPRKFIKFKNGMYGNISDYKIN